MVSSLLSARNIGSVSMDNCLLDFVRKGIIEDKTAMEAAQRPDYIEQNVHMRARMR